MIQRAPVVTVDSEYIRKMYLSFLIISSRISLRTSADRDIIVNYIFLYSDWL